MKSENFETLRLALEALSHEELVNLVINVANDNDGVKQAILKALQIPSHIIISQPQDKEQVQRLKKEIDSFFAEETMYRFNDYEYSEAEEYEELDNIIQTAKLLHPRDQTNVYYYLLTKGNKFIYSCPMGTGNFEDAFELYGQAVKQLGLLDNQKQFYLDTLLTTLDWEMCNYGNVIGAIKTALNTVADQPEDYRYLIDHLKTKGEEYRDWVAKYYLKLGDDEKYLKLRTKRLLNEDHYLELAEYWQTKGDQKRYITTLEQFVDTLSKSKTRTDSFLFSDLNEGALEKLIDFYIKQNDYNNLYRILLVKTRFKRKTLDLYKQLQKVAKRLQKWPEAREAFLQLAKDEAYLLAEVYLYEHEYQSAIEVAKQAKDYEYESVINLVTIW